MHLAENRLSQVSKEKGGMESEMEVHFVSGRLWQKMMGAKGQGQISEKTGPVAGSTQR